MTDETFSLFAIAGAIAAGASLWFRFRRSQSLRRLEKMLERDGIIVRSDGEVKFVSKDGVNSQVDPVERE
jgi:hypothetical protein